MSFLTRIINKKYENYISRHINYIYAKDYLYSNSRELSYFCDKNLRLGFSEVKNCFVYGENCQFISPEKDKNVIFEESFCYKQGQPRKEHYCIYNKCKNIKRESLDEAVPLNFMWNDNLAHWVYDSLPRVIFLEEQGYKGQYIVSRKKHITEFLHLFGVDNTRICYSDKDYYVKRVILPHQYSFFTDKEHNTTLACYLHDNIRNCVKPLSGSNRIYIKRVNTKLRKVINEDEVESLLKKYDIQIVIPEEFSSIKEQFRLMTNVNLTVAPHGANCTPIIAQQKKSTFIELFNNTQITYHFCVPVLALSLNYIPLVGEISSIFFRSKKEAKAHLHKDILVPILPFKIILENSMKSLSSKNS